jgi:hypothetical protein
VGIFGNIKNNKMEFTQKDLDELLKYIQHLEEENRGLKAMGITLTEQRNSALRKLKSGNEQHKEVRVKTVDTDFEII